MSQSCRFFVGAIILSAVVVTTGCSSTGSTGPPQTPVPIDKTDRQNIYFYQHKLLPKWLYESNGVFLDDLLVGELDQLRAAAADLVGPDYANAIGVQAIAGKEAVLITFPEPQAPPECYFVLVQRNGGTLSYMTYEMTFSLGDSGAVGVVGAWNADGSHGNLGPRTYREPQAFVKDIVGED